MTCCHRPIFPPASRAEPIHGRSTKRCGRRHLQRCELLVARSVARFRRQVSDVAAGARPPHRDVLDREEWTALSAVSQALSQVGQLKSTVRSTQTQPQSPRDALASKTVHARKEVGIGRGILATVVIELRYGLLGRSARRCLNRLRQRRMVAVCFSFNMIELHLRVSRRRTCCSGPGGRQEDCRECSRD